MEYVWTMREICMECSRTLYGTCEAHVWIMRGLRMAYSSTHIYIYIYIEYVWDICAPCVRKRMEFARDMRGMSMEYGMCMEYEWNAYVICME